MSKYIQALIPIELYRGLVNKTIDKKLTLKKGIQEAIELYIGVNA